MIRFLDIFISIFGLLFLSPLLIIICICGCFDTGSPLFSQKRIGRYKTHFTLVKFRSMHKDSPSVASHLVNTATISSFGYFLRKTKLDELPQLINVIKGEMSLVGPRPGLPNQPDLTEIREEYGVYSVRPGITGLAQVSGIDMSTPELLAQTDAKMISQMSVLNYFKYILLTILGKGGGDRIKL